MVVVCLALLPHVYSVRFTARFPISDIYYYVTINFVLYVSVIILCIHVPVSPTLMKPQLPFHMHIIMSVND